MTDYAVLRRAIADRLPIVTYTNRFAPAVETLWVSPQVERLTGYRPGDWVGRPGFFESVLHPDDRAPVLEEMRASREERRAFSRDYRLLSPQGDVVWIHDESVPIVDEGDEPGMIQGFFVEIGERKELERQLLHAQKLEAIGRLAAGIAHDFNNVLTAIGAHATLALRGLPQGSAVRRHLVELMGTVDSAGRLTRQLLAFGRGRPPAPVLVDLTSVVGGLRPLLRSVAGDWVRLEVDLGPTPQVHADPSQLEQIVVNLVANARDAESGSITIRTVAAGDEAVLIVADDGHGMDEETRARAFDAFFTTRDEDNGTGLGLAIVQRIVTAAGGSIALESAPGRGTRVEIRLPAAPLG